HGTQIVCRRWLRGKESLPERALWDVGVLTCARGGAKENGDAFVVKRWDDCLLVGVVDGLGHGEHAQRAAVAAQQYVQTHYDQPMEKIFEGTGRACRGTRGVVMALARFLSPTELEWGSVGNVEVRAWSGEERIPFAIRRGILGAYPARV